LFIAVYHLLLEKEIIHRFKRWYLLITLILSFGIPLITIEIDQPELATQLSKVSQYLGEDIRSSSEPTQVTFIAPENTSIDFNWSAILFIAYGIITSILLVRIFNNFLSILSDVNDKTVRPYRDALLVLHNKHVIPYSFLNYIFISHQDSTDKHILLHELTHIRQRHTLDILFVEIIHCLMWFNPAIYFYKKAIRLNHEFLADEVVLKNFPTSDYQSILFQKTQVSSGISLTSSFNYSATKKRFIMMTTTKNLKRSLIKMTLSLMFICSVALLFSGKVYSQGTDENKLTVAADTVKGATPEMLAEFDTLIEKFKVTMKKPYEHIALNITGMTDEERTRIQKIYGAMTEKQKASYPKAIMWVAVPMPPPTKKSPTADQMTAWSDPKIYGVWLDGKRIANAELANYKPTDIAHVFMSRLMKNAAHYGQYKFHVDLMTHDYFNKTYPPKSN
jgi:hypothetical protein